MGQSKLYMPSESTMLLTNPHPLRHCPDCHSNRSFDRDIERENQTGIKYLYKCRVCGYKARRDYDVDLTE